MRKVIFLLTLISSLHFGALAQQSAAPNTDAKQALKIQLNEMGALFLKNDYNSFVAHMNPRIVEISGGKSSVIEKMQSDLLAFESKGFRYSDLIFDEPGAIIRKGAELQSTVAQNLIVKVPNGRIRLTSTLIAISTDDGAHWSFMDSGGRSFGELKKHFPNLSPKLSLPPKSHSAMVPDDPD